MRQFIGLVLILTSLCLSACGGPDGWQYFSFPIEVTADVKADKTLTPGFICHARDGQLSLNIADSLYIAFDRNKDNLCSVYNINDGFSLIAEFCPQGRALEEIISLGGVNDIWSYNDLLSLPLYVLSESKLLTFNLSESIIQHKTIYNTVTRLSPGERKPFYNCFMLDSTHIIAYNSHQNPVVDEMLEPPTFEVYDIQTGTLTRTYGILNKIEGYKDPIYNSLAFVANSACIKPDRKKLAFAMYYHPQFNILDTETGKTIGFHIKGRSAFSARHPDGHFIAISADNDCFYALYQGKSSINEVTPPVSLYVIDWDGNIKNHFKLRHSYNLLCADGNNLYLASRINDELYSCPREAIKTADSKYLSAD